MSYYNPHAPPFQPSYPNQLHPYPTYSYPPNPYPGDDAAAQAQAYRHQWDQYHTQLAYHSEYQSANGYPRPYDPSTPPSYPYFSQNVPYGPAGAHYAVPSSSQAQDPPYTPEHSFASGCDPKAGMTKNQRKKFNAKLKNERRAEATGASTFAAHTAASTKLQHPQSQANNRSATDVKEPTQMVPVKRAKGGKEPKIMLPAPQPTAEYMIQATQTPSLAPSPTPILVILDLNGTLLFRPSSKNKQRMVARPFLGPFLRYLMSNFAVMVWSSARPDNVNALVRQSLDEDLRSKLVAVWSRDHFGLSAEHYQRNVQVYKNLELIWRVPDIQKTHPTYTSGDRYGQHNTVLIDDSMLKANAQPHNLLQITEFAATPTDMKSDVLRKVAGYLEVLRSQNDVSKFIHATPFSDDGPWTYEWPHRTVAGDAEGGEMTQKVSLAEGEASRS